MSTWNGTGSSWQYSKWVNNISRNMKISEPTGAELTAVKTFLKVIWNPQTQTGTRSWLQTAFNKKSVTAAGSSYQGNIDLEPTVVLVEMLTVVGRDLKKQPLTNTEKTAADTMIAASNNRRYGTKPYYGSTAGSTVSVP